MIKRIMLILIITALCSPFFMSSVQATNQLAYDNEPLKLLLIHSYAHDLSWTANEHEGFIDALKNNHYNFDITIDYMDTKHYQSDTYFDLYHDLFTYKHSTTDYDLIAVTDDNALRYILSVKNQYFENTPVFFCGSNSKSIYDFSAYKHVYGIRERSSLADTMSMIYALQPNVNKVYFLFDESITAGITISDLQEQITYLQSQTHFDFLTAPTLDQLKYKISAIEDPNSVFIYGFYMTDASGIAYDPNDSVSRMLQSTKLPIYALWDFAMDTGAIGGKLVSGYEQGHNMGELVNQYLNQTISTQFLDASLGNTYIVDYKALESFGFDINQLPYGTHIINKPETFFERHRSVIIGATILAIMLIIYIIILRLQVKRKTKTIEQTTQQMMEYRRQASLNHLIKGVAHDINTPLGNIITMIDFAKKMNRDADSDDPRLAETLTRIESSANRITSTIDTFKQVSVTSNQTEFKAFTKKNHTFYESVEGIATLIIAQHQVAIGFTMHGKKQIRFPMTDEHLYSILHPLIQNSFDHGFSEDTAGEIEIHIDQNEEGIIIKYTDNGIGIVDADMNQLFEPFYSTAKHKKHSGLGLFQAYNTITAYCGSINCINNEKTGVTFIITLPFTCSII